MAVPQENPKAIEKQTELYPEKEVDWGKLSNIDIKFQIGEKDTDPGSFLRALKMALKTEFPNKKESETFASAIDRRAIHRGFDPHLAFAADLFRITKGALYIDMKNGSKMAVKLDPNATLEAGYEEKLPETVQKTRGAWESLREVLRHGILADILPALTGDRAAGSFGNRNRIWQEVMEQTEEYKGAYEQNKAMVEFLKNNQKNADVVAKLQSVGEEKIMEKERPAASSRPPEAAPARTPPPQEKRRKELDKDEKYFSALGRRPERPIERKLYDASSFIIDIGQARLDGKVQMVSDHVKVVEANMRQGDAIIIKNSIERTFQELVQAKTIVQNLETRLNILLPKLQEIDMQNLTSEEKAALQEKLQNLDEKETDLAFWTMEIETHEGTLKKFARQFRVTLPAA